MDTSQTLGDLADPAADTGAALTADAADRLRDDTGLRTTAATLGGGGRPGMQTARIVLLLSAVPFAAIAGGFLVAPSPMANAVGVTLTNATADNDVRAVYGGLQLGLAVFLVLAAQRPAWWRAGVALQLCAFGGLAAARIVSGLVVGLPAGLGLALHAAELAGVAAGVVAWRSLAVEPTTRPAG